MPTIISHPAPVLALGVGLGLARVPVRLLLAAVFFSIVPDFDVAGFRLGVSYSDLLGHRGFSHSLFFAFCSGLFGALAAPWLRCRRPVAFVVLFFAVTSHIVLDAATSGGLGVAAFWPVTGERYFLPWRPIRVSPLSLKAFFGSQGIAVLMSELTWLWLPSLGVALLLRVSTTTANTFLKTRQTRILCGLVLLSAALTGSYYLLLPHRAAAKAPLGVTFREGDILFQSSVSGQGRAIQLATGSRYTHCGIILEKNGRLVVYEAISTMSWTPIADWIGRGSGGEYVLMRLKNSGHLLTPDKLAGMRKAGLKLSSKTYDTLFQWSDDKIYCSELVWKIYERGANIKLAPLRTFREYTLDSDTVQTLIKNRYGSNFSLDEKAVSPDDLMRSPLLETVTSK